MKRICTVEQVRKLEQESFKSIASHEVMHRAASAIAAACAHQESVLAVAGAGNNGGDAIVAASKLVAQGVQVHVWLPLGEPRADSDAAKALAAWRSAGGKTHLDSEPSADVGYSLLIDGLFGIGLDRDLTGAAAAAVAWINDYPASVIAADIPSGLDADTGAVRGCAVKADRTVTFFAGKPGLYMRSGPDLAGDISIDTLGFDDLAQNAGGELIDGCICGEQLRRSSDSNKGTFGTVVAVGGAQGMTGALVLATRAAVAHGAGKVFAVTLDKPPAFDPHAPEVMWREVNDGSRFDEFIPLFGCGLGRSKLAASIMENIGSDWTETVYDADALNWFAEKSEALSRKRLAKQDVIFTPHPAEAARLLKTETSAVQKDRLGSALKLAKSWNNTVVLKGAGTVIADRHGKWGIVAAGNPALAQAGSGDVLAGIIAALRAQGLGSWPAAVNGAWLHAAAADQAAAEQGGYHGVRLARIIQLSSMMLAAAANPLR